MKLYKHKTTSELIEFVGLANEREFVFRYLGDESKTSFFNILETDVKRYWEKVED